MKKNRIIYIPLILSFVLSGCKQTAYYKENEIASSSELLTFKFLNDEKNRVIIPFQVKTKLLKKIFLFNG